MIRRWQARRNFLEYDFTVYPTVAREASRAAEVVGDDHDEPRGCGFESPHTQSSVLVRSTIRMAIDEPLTIMTTRGDAFSTPPIPRALFLLEVRSVWR